MSGYIHRLEQQASAIEEIQSTILDRLENAVRDETEVLKNEYFTAVSECFSIAKTAYDTKPENLDDVLQKAEDILSDAITFAYRGEGDPSRETEVFSQFPSFAHEDGTRPLVKWSGLPEGHVSHWQAEMLGGLARILGPQYAKNLKEKFKPPPTWKATPRPHPLSSRCARFVHNVTDATFVSVPNRVLNILQGRFELSNDRIASPGDISVSRDGKGFVLETHGGYKEREPFIEYYSFVDEARCGSIIPGLEGLNHSCFDHERFLIVGGDDRRMKVWTMAPLEYKGHDKTLPLYTMKTKRFSGPIAFLPGNRIARAGKGELAVWDMGKLPTHGPSGRDIIGKEMSEESLEWGVEEDEVELSSGTPPHSKQQLPWKDHNIGTWHAHPSSDTVMLCGTERYETDRYYCHAVDLEHGGKVSARYLGLGGSVTGFSTSQGDQNCFTVASTDGFVRLYDCRTLLPALTLAVSPKDNEDFQPSAVLCHPDGVPLLFSAASNEECVKLWDLRCNASIYEMATGNNQVEALAWNDHNTELCAITRNPNLGRMGDHYSEDYRRAKLTHSQTKHTDDDYVWNTGGAQGEDDDWEDEDEDSDDEDDDHDMRWPRRAYHDESYWGYVFDEGDHTIFKYTFKENPDPKAVPTWEEF